MQNDPTSTLLEPKESSEDELQDSAKKVGVTWCHAPIETFQVFRYQLTKFFLLLIKQKVITTLMEIMGVVISDFEQRLISTSHQLAPLLWIFIASWLEK